MTEAGIARAVLKRVLVTYATMSGSTVEVAEAIASEVRSGQVEVDVLPIDSVGSLAGYDALVVGGPMILGWHRAARRFLRRNAAALPTTPFAVFVTAMTLTDLPAPASDGIWVYVDANLPKPPVKRAALTIRERYAQLSNYLKPILRTARPGRPISIGVFGGKVEYGRLSWWAVVFAMVILRVPAADRRNWDAIRAWARDLPSLFGLPAATAG